MQPLSEIFSSAQKQGERTNASPSAQRSPTKGTAPPRAATKAMSTVQEASEDASHPQYPDLTEKAASSQQNVPDSGDHVMSDDVFAPTQQTQPEAQPPTQPSEDEPTPIAPRTYRSPSHQMTEDSFHSAQENIRQRGETVEPASADTTPKPRVEVKVPRKSKAQSPEPKRGSEPKLATTPEPESEPAEKSAAQPQEPAPSSPARPEEPEEQNQKETAATESFPPKSVASQLEGKKPDVEKTHALDNLDDIGTPSEDSSPERPLVRKSSLTFASLPAREPLTKKSLGGPRMSRTSHVETGKPSMGGSNYFGRQTGGQRQTQTAVERSSQDDKMDVDEPPNEDAGIRASRLHNKSSTQRLHEKISMLGKSQPSGPTKSIPSAQVAYPELPAGNKNKSEQSQQKQNQTTTDPMEVDGGEWIKPMAGNRPTLAKSQTMDVMEQLDLGEADASPVKDGRPATARQTKPATLHMVDNPDDSGRPKTSAPIYSSPRPGHMKSASASNLAAAESTTPIGSPGRNDGPLSASKSRLQSIMKSAKGLFSTSGGLSAAARVEASSPDEQRLETRNRANTARNQMRTGSPKQEGRRTRSSTEKEEKRKQKELEDRRQEEQKAQEQERQKAAELKASKEEAETQAQTAQNPAPSPEPQHSQRQASKDLEPSYETGSKAKQNERRPAKPTRDAVQKPKPQPVSIRVGSALSRQMPLASNNLASSVQDSNPPAPAPSTSRQPAVKKKASNQSLHTASSNSSFKSSASSQSQRKAQLAHERKKEQEEREARRKEEQKRELERKRAAQQQQQQQDEARRQEMRKRAEAERREREQERAAIEESKQAAQRQAMEKRRLENARRERQGSQQPGNEMVSVTVIFSHR